MKVAQAINGAGTHLLIHWDTHAILLTQAPIEEEALIIDDQLIPHTCQIIPKSCFVLLITLIAILSLQHCTIVMIIQLWYQILLEQAHFVGINLHRFHRTSIVLTLKSIL